MEPVPYFKRSPFLTFRILALLSLLVFGGLICSDIAKRSPGLSAIYYTLYILIALALLIYQGKKFNYFGVSDKALLIRNSFFTWRYREIPFSGMQSIRIDSNSFDHWLGNGYSSPYYLMVFYEGSEKEKFYGAALNGKQWALLTAELEKYGVRVINTCHYIPFKDVL